MSLTILTRENWVALWLSSNMAEVELPLIYVTTIQIAT